MATRREVNFGILSTVAAAAAVAAASSEALAQTPQTIALPAPDLAGGKPLMQAFSQRQSMRDYSDAPLSNQDLSNLLWAAWGVNRPANGGRTAPHWHGILALDIYVTRADGVWLYDPKAHKLTLHMAGDLRGQTTTNQAYVVTAPVNLVFAFDMAKVTPAATESEKVAASAACTAVVSQNIYLYCASAGLATVLRQNVPGPALAKALKLPANQIVDFCQTVGHPKAA